MNPAATIAPRTLFRALVTRALGEGGLHSAASLLLSPPSAPIPEDEVVVSSAIFGAADVIIPPPPLRLRGRSATVMGCGHLGLLYHPAALGQVAAFLGEPAEEPRKAARALRAA